MRVRDCGDDRQTEADSATRPRACVIGAGETIEDPVECLRWDAAAAVDDLDHEIAAQPEVARSSIVSCSSVYFTAFSSSASSAARSASSSAAMLTASDRAEAPPARRNLGPTHEDVFDERLDVDLAETARNSARAGFREQEEPGDDPLDSAELIERDRELRRAPAVELE